MMNKNFNDQKTMEAINAVANFLEKNYPCSCDDNDPDCPGEIYEAEAIVEIVLNKLAESNA